MSAAQEKINLPEISLGDLLSDAATVLDQNGLKALGRGTRIASSLLGGPSKGEAWISDIMLALDAADAAVHAAQSGEECDLAPLRDALERVRNWGLEPQERLGNAFIHVVRLAAMFIAAGELKKSGMAVDEAAIASSIEAFVDALGFDGAGMAQSEVPNG